MYAIVSTTEFYGPETREDVVGFSRSRRAAEEYLAAKEREATARYGCHMLAHGQSSGTSYTIRRFTPARCARGFGGAPMYKGYYLPNDSELDRKAVVPV